jgi:RNA polymerase sigma-70 factor (ECF subfamily)
VGSATTTGDARSVALVLRAQSGDRDAFSSLIRQHDLSMRRLAYGIVGDRGAMDDALQEAYLRAYRGLPGFHGDSAFGTWLYRIVYRTCLDELRRRKAVAPLDDAVEIADTKAGPDAQATARHDIDAAMAKLSSDMRAAVWLVDGEGLSYDEAAGVLGVPPGTIASRVSRARVQLRRALDPMRGSDAP